MSKTKPMTKEQKQKLITAAWKTWHQIGNDAYSLCAEFNETLTNAAAIEFIVDADRISTIGGYDPFDDGLTWNQVVRALNKEQFA